MKKYILISGCNKVLLTTYAKNMDNAFNIANKWRSISWNNNKIEHFNECQAYWLLEFELESRYVQLIVNL
jgi:hypothetical protein